MLNSLTCFKTIKTSCLCYFYNLYFTKDYPLVGHELGQSLGDGEFRETWYAAAHVVIEHGTRPCN